MSKEILVTGGAGFIGSHTCVALCEFGYTPVIIDNLSNSRESMIAGIEKIIGREVKFYPIDCCHLDPLDLIFQKHRFDGIIHFAAFKSVAESVANPEKYMDNNMGSLQNILTLMEKYRVPNLVFSSSCTVYGEPEVNPVSENTPWKSAASPYGYTKQLGEKYIGERHIQDPIGHVILRYFNPIGAHHSGLIGELPLGMPNNLVPVMIKKISQQQPLQVFGNDYPTPDGSCIRDYIHVMDLAEAHVKALQWLEKNPNQSEIFNLGQGKGNSVLEVIQQFESINGIRVAFEISPRREGDITQIFADPTKAKELLGWQTTRTTAEALKDAWHFNLQQS